MTVTIGRLPKGERLLEAEKEKRDRGESLTSTSRFVQVRKAPWGRLWVGSKRGLKKSEMRGRRSRKPAFEKLEHVLHD